MKAYLEKSRSDSNHEIYAVPVGGGGTYAETVEVRPREKNTSDTTHKSACVACWRLVASLLP